MRWEWIGNGHHNVIAKDGLFDSGSPEEGTIFEYTFDELGTTYYFCKPHQQAGMKGVVVVESDADSGAAETEAGGK